MSWFPLFQGLFQNDDFKTLTPSAKLYSLFLISEANLRGGAFFKSDLEISTILAVSEKTIQRGRKALGNRNLIEFESGFRDKRRKHLATRYLKVKWANVREYKGDSYAQMDRYTFNTTLAWLREKRFQQTDILVYVYLTYLRHWNNGNNEFFVTKRRLMELAHLENPTERVNRLYNCYVSADGNRLFEYVDYCHSFKFSEWAIIHNPENNEHNQKLEEHWRSEVKEIVERKRGLRQKAGGH